MRVWLGGDAEAGDRVDMSVAHVKEPDWHMVHCPRLATAPLRFKGRLLDERPSGVPGLSFALYERQKGGLAAVLPGWTRGQWRTDALRANGWGDLLDEVERRCSNLSEPISEPLSAETLLTVHLRFKMERAKVLEAAGHALDHWQRLAERHSEQS